MRTSKLVDYLNWINTHLIAANDGYVVGRAVGDHGRALRDHGYRDIGGFLQQSMQSVIILNLGKVFEDRHDKKYDKLTLPALLQHIAKNKYRTKLHNRLAAYDYLGLKDAGKGVGWTNQAVVSKMSSDIRTGKHRRAIAALKYYRDTDVAHKQRMPKKTAPRLTWNDILSLLEYGHSLMKTIDSIYLNYGFTIEGPMDAEYGKLMHRLISDACSIPRRA